MRISLPSIRVEQEKLSRFLIQNPPNTNAKAISVEVGMEKHAFSTLLERIDKGQVTITYENNKTI